MRKVRFIVPALMFVLVVLLAIGQGGVPVASAVPANDNFANSVVLTTPARSGTVATADTTGATNEVGETTALSGCAPGGATPTTGSTVWYTWTSSGISGSTVFDTYGSSFDTVIAVYTGNSLGTLTLVACNDDFGGALQSGVAISNSPSTTYRIQVGGFSGAQGSLTLNVSRAADMVVNSTADTNVADAVLTLREAMILAESGTLLLGRGLTVTLSS